MVIGRHILLVGAVVVTAACSEPAAQAGRAPAPPSFYVTEVTVDASRLSARGTRGLLSVPEIGADLRYRISKRLFARSDPTGVPVSVSITLTDLALLSPIENAIPGARSRIAGTVAIENAAPRAVTGVSERVRIPGVLGMITAPDHQTDYIETASGFAEEIADAVF